MEWDDPAIGSLRTLWAEGHATAEIGRRLGCSKSAAVGKAHRLDLEPRPSPIKRGHAPPPTQGLPDLGLSDSGLPDLGQPTPRLAPPPRPAPPPPRPKLVLVPHDHAPPVHAPPPPREATPLPYRPIVQCRWPNGTPGKAGFRFCDAPSAPGKSYCAEHCKRAFVKVREMAE